jgi:hypothetical protein
MFGQLVEFSPLRQATWTRQGSIEQTKFDLTRNSLIDVADPQSSFSNLSWLEEFDNIRRKWENLFSPTLESLRPFEIGIN